MGNKIENTPTKQNISIDEILEVHGKRTSPDEMMSRRAMKNVHAHWQASLIKKQKQRKTLLLRIAAAVMLMVTTGVFIQHNIKYNNPDSIAHSLYTQGEVLISKDNKNWQIASQDDINKQLSPGTWLRTRANSFASITLMDNSHLRINQNSQLQLISSSRIKLQSGELYHDADNITKSTPITINTALGDVNHIGTRYLVNINESNLHVAVRNGLVEISDGNHIKKQLQAGKQIHIQSSGKQQESTVLSYDRLWNWTKNAGQPFITENKSLYDFVNWYAHENGYQIDWNQQQLNAKRVKLSGKFSQLNSNQQIKTIFLATKFDYDINQGILSIL